MGRLLMARHIDEVLHLVDEVAPKQATPVTPSGKIGIDDAKTRHREDEMVKAALDAGLFGLVVLRGTHDLSASVMRVAGGQCEYGRLTTVRTGRSAADDRQSTP